MASGYFQCNYTRTMMKVDNTDLSGSKYFSIVSNLNLKINYNDFVGIYTSVQSERSRIEFQYLPIQLYH